MTATLATPDSPASPPPQLSPGGRTAIRTLLIVAAAVLLIAVVALSATAAWGVSSFRVVKDSMPLPATLTAVEIDTGSVPVAIRLTSDRESGEPRVDMRMVNSVRAGADPLSVDADGTTARVTIDAEPSEFLRWGRAGEITLVLPPELARRLTVTTRQDVGVVFAQTDLDQFIAHTVDGTVVLNGAARRIDITTEDGDVTTRDPISVSQSFRARTTSGDVSVEFAETPDTIDAETQRGDVVVTLPPPGPYFVDASTGTDNGATVVRVPQTRDREAAASLVTARTDSGDVVISDGR
ncbi:DUF4097 family beta strand repeat-containing protein [Mycolicibacterium vaccae]|uniref:DUF4097 domain-containing protein n=1 Tax=Mycolicibacterium vaccae ATCC 25954 TaxID=1194972 RepID=K0V8F9_MYCVA|nr:DUF4097 family beta strand repeat-containing protein [Mycolicibacterium vaccae]ANI41284.1 hypothetical protein MYVA_4186 [Mycolicibacterium vaccae 95051]EJZ11153.1 hypothetical protein MVAC_06832 [Mycolicibacterium vaccae ATCC 25954]MCV7063510.1 DUF4097 family beta strand repeat protein [Mycolicibacterium vaccae]